MSELEKIIKRRHFPVRVKLSAVRDRLIEELDFSEVLIKYNVCSSTFQGWLNKYKSRVLSEESYKRLSLPVDNPKTLLFSSFLKSGCDKNDLISLPTINNPL